MPVDPPPFVFGPPEIFFTLLATFIIGAILGPRWWRERKAQRAE